MTDNETLDTEEKELSWYAKQRAKFKEELDAVNAKYEAERQWRIQDKVAYFKNTLSSQGYKWDFDEFANKYAENLSLDEMVALYRGTNGAVQVATQTVQPEQTQTEAQIWPKSVIWTNPIGGVETKDFNSLTLDEMKAWWRANPQIFSE